MDATPTFVEEHHDLLKGLHEVDVVVAVLLDLQQQAELGQTLGGEGFQQKAVLLQRRETTRRYVRENGTQLTLLGVIMYVVKARWCIKAY